MGPDQLGIFWLIISSVAICTLIFGIRYLSNKENMAMSEGIYKFILIAENVLNFHSGDKDYYEEWLEDVEAKGGWIVCINMPEQTQYDFRRAKLDRYIGLMELPDWRIFKPFHLFKRVSAQLEKRLNSSADNGSSEN